MNKVCLPGVPSCQGCPDAHNKGRAGRVALSRSHARRGVACQNLQVFTKSTHIVAVKTTGNVYCYEVRSPCRDYTIPTPPSPSTPGPADLCTRCLNSPSLLMPNHVRAGSGGAQHQAKELEGGCALCGTQMCRGAVPCMHRIAWPGSRAPGLTGGHPVANVAGPAHG